MTGRTLPALLAAAGILGGCVIPLSLKERRPGPGGETAKVTAAQGRALSGEFIGIRGDRLVLLTEGRFIELALPPDAEVRIESYAAIEVRERKKLLLHARYPQGLTDEQWAELLRAQGQSSFDEAPSR